MSELKQHLIVDDKKLVSDLWEEEDESKRNWNLSLADGLVQIAPMFYSAVKKKARIHKEIFSVSCLSAYNEQDYDSEQIVEDTVLHSAMLLLDITKPREQQKLLSWFKDFVAHDQSSWVQPLSEQPDEDIDWLIPNWLQRGVVHQYQGEMDKGKSMLTTHIGAQLSAGGVIFGEKVRAGKVLMFSAEDSPTKVIKARAKSMGAELSNIISLNGKVIPKFPSVIPELYEIIVQHRPELVVIDPILAMFEGDMNKETDVRGVISDFGLIADFFNIAFIVVTHTGKMKYNNPNHNALGSQGGSASVRANYQIGLDEDTDERIITCIKSNNGGKKLSFKYKIEEHEGFKAPRVIELGLTETKAQELGTTEPLKDELKKDILEYISEHTELGISARALTTYFKDDPRVSNSMKTFENARAELNKAGKIHSKKRANLEGRQETFWYPSE